MMDDLISRNALFDAMREEEFQTFVPLDEVDAVIDKAPAIEAEPVRHGEWKKRTIWFKNFGENQMVCSECNKLYGFHANYHYCPNCGAHMRGETDGE